MEEGLFNFIRKGTRLFFYRLRTQGIQSTLIWLYGRGTSIITGIPVMRYSQITPEIYVGSQHSQVGKRKLKQFGINGSVNLRIEFDDAVHGLNLEEYCYLPTVDETPPTLEQLGKGVIFIEQIVRNGGKVYIHCRGGMGRAPTMAAAYFISRGYTLDEAIGLIKKARPFINIRSVQLEQLKRFELRCTRS